MHELVNADELKKTKWNAEMFFIDLEQKLTVNFSLKIVTLK